MKHFLCSASDRKRQLIHLAILVDSVYDFFKQTPSVFLLRTQLKWLATLM